MAASKIESAAPRGRPRDPARSQAILEATYRLLVEEGYAELTIAKLAAAAGVSTATVYRWWPSKEAVVMDSYLAAVERRVAARGRKRSGLAQLKAQLGTTALAFAGSEGRAMISLVHCARQSPEVGEAFLERLIRPRRAQDRKLVQRCIEEGSLRADLRPDVLLDALYGPLYFRLFVQHAGLSPAYVRQHVKLLLEGAGPE